MFKANMIAPCGLDCNLCNESLKRENPCPGCNGSNEYKPEFCSIRCKIINCEFRGSLQGDYCDKCPQYPCEHLHEREYRYMNQYPLSESPMNNLKMIREKGMDYFLEKQKEYWTCPECGGIISVHTGLCSNCSKNYQHNMNMASAKDYDELLLLWEASVRSTHHFLTEDDIQYYKPLIRNEYFQAVELHLIRDGQTQQIVAFMGLSDDLIEMLFVHPAQQGKGYGKKLIEYAIQKKNIRKVDVNEQNEQALRFYRNRGFEVIARDATDGQGKPYPILHMQLKPVRLRKAESKDLPELRCVFEESVRTSCRKNYSPEQIDAWINRASPERWQELFSSDLQFIIAEETESFRITGFTSFNQQGYLHSMFLLPQFQEQGIATILLDHAEDFAHRNHLPSLFAEVSLTARPFFEKHGFIVEEEQAVKIKDIEMTNFKMRKFFIHDL